MCISQDRATKATTPQQYTLHRKRSIICPTLSPLGWSLFLLSFSFSHSFPSFFSLSFLLFPFYVSQNLTFSLFCLVSPFFRFKLEIQLSLPRDIWNILFQLSLLHVQYWVNCSSYNPITILSKTVFFSP